MTGRSRSGVRPGVARAAAALLLASCAGHPPPVVPSARTRPRLPEVLAERLPPGFPPPLIPADNPLTREKVELGRRLFYDPRLSGNGTQSCGSCHRQELAFTDGRARAVGSTGQVHPRSAMSLTNVAYLPALTWADPRVTDLEAQALIPMRNERPVELGLAGREEEMLERLRADPAYVRWFRGAFPEEEDPIRLRNVVWALASFERTLISGSSPYDRLVYGGEMEALDETAWRGLRLFFSDRLSCSGCHGGLNLSGAIAFLDPAPRPPGADRAVIGEVELHNTGLYDVDGRGSYPDRDTGLFQVTGRRRDMGRFRAPTLRNIALTAPYMHDGSIPTLAEAIDHYAAGGRAGASRYRDPLIQGFDLSGEERADLLAFLASLTDERFVSDPRLSDPWKKEQPGASPATFPTMPAAGLEASPR